MLNFPPKSNISFLAFVRYSISHFPNVGTHLEEILKNIEMQITYLMVYKDLQGQPYLFLFHLTRSNYY